MGYEITTLLQDAFPPLLREIPDSPRKLYLRGTLPPPDTKFLTVVGSRQYTSYGKQVVERLVGGLRGYPISIVSGLALGIDSLAHKAALDTNLHTVAIPGSGLFDDVIYPRTHRALAKKILECGGALLSEFEPDFKTAPWCFAARNRIVAGMSHATLIVEAKEKSGTLITARLATDYNRDVLAVPGSILSKNSYGPHMLIRLGAIPVTSPRDVLEALGFDTPPTSEDVMRDMSPDERRILELLGEPRSRDEVIALLKMPAQSINVLLSMMELHGYIKEQSGKITRLV